MSDDVIRRRALDALASQYSPAEVARAAKAAIHIDGLLSYVPPNEAILAMLMAGANRFVRDSHGETNRALFSLMCDVAFLGASAHEAPATPETDDELRELGRVYEITDGHPDIGTRWVVCDDRDTSGAKMMRCIGPMSEAGPPIGTVFSAGPAFLRDSCKRLGVVPADETKTAIRYLAKHQWGADAVSFSPSLDGLVVSIVWAEPPVHGTHDDKDLAALCHPWAKIGAVIYDLAEDPDPNGNLVGTWWADKANEGMVALVQGSLDRNGIPLLAIKRFAAGERSEEVSISREHFLDSHEPISKEEADRRWGAK